MLKHTRTRMLAASTGQAGWTHPYTDPFTLYADGGDGGGDADGGQGDAGTDDGDDSGTDDGTGDDGDDDADGQDGAKLGEKGVKALRELRRENRRLKAQLRQHGDDGDRAGSKAPAKDDGTRDGDPDDPEAIRERARAEARAEVWAERVEAAAIAAASGRLANPHLAARLLRDHLADVGEDDKGRPDKTAISELIDELLEDEPYLAAPAKGNGRRFQGDADGGARKPAKKTAASLGEAVANRLAGKTG